MKVCLPAFRTNSREVDGSGHIEEARSILPASAARAKREANVARAFQGTHALSRETKEKRQAVGLGLRKRESVLFIDLELVG